MKLLKAFHKVFEVLRASKKFKTSFKKVLEGFSGIWCFQETSRLPCSMEFQRFYKVIKDVQGLFEGFQEVSKV